ncbi:MlaD family protein [Actinomadura algeriensis]|uniref:Phospholipid/cholesterol/gamma-HCH transport system substrate-binding protein n=1 Tax=Actinomadura algeriensis TaxID=1679523 RepID=A0ABR9JLJ3_9ACTN|nr:MlaD family protein [Actinomadura algeriensis]MBE1530985.1 phospholipid/cholesterol/gamma-HCH transport system substrate-binding protein [Actinomadura algeriensis]
MSGLLRGKTARGPDYRTLLKFVVFVAVTGLLTFFIGQQILGTTFADRYRLSAKFDDVTGLVEGDQVKVAGTPVGRVEGIEVVRGKAVVEMAVDTELKMPKDSTAAIRWRNVMGQRVIYLEPGPSKEMLDDGDRVPHTQSVVDLGAIINNIGPLTRNLDPDQLNKILFSFSQALEGNEQNISVLTNNLDVLLQTFASRKDTISEMIDDYETVSGAVATRDKQIAASIDNLESLVKVFADNRQLLENATVQIAGVTTNLNRVLGGNDAQLARIIRNLGELSETFRLNVDELEQMVQKLPLTLRQLFSAANGGHFLRTNALCLNIQMGPCPFEMELPKAPGTDEPTKQELEQLRAMLTKGGD